MRGTTGNKDCLYVPCKQFVLSRYYAYGNIPISGDDPSDVVCTTWMRGGSIVSMIIMSVNNLGGEEKFRQY